MKLWDYSVLAGKFRKVPAICRNNAGSVAHFLQQQCYDFIALQKIALPLREKYFPCLRGFSLTYSTHIMLMKVGKDADAHSTSCLVSENYKISYWIHLYRSQLWCEYQRLCITTL